MRAPSPFTSTRRTRRQHDHVFGDDVTVRSSKAELYKLLYATKSRELGVKLWNESTREKPDGQLGFYMPGE